MSEDRATNRGAFCHLIWGWAPATLGKGLKYSNRTVTLIQQSEKYSVDNEELKLFSQSIS